ncbi:MAG: SDR family NAD(P)-dependent oxidoreductase [Chloroflexi bacterium]|nr:SDR family NAD(P)-dependent oxidoreductase [Chloroflexota bacterium]
MVLERFRLDGKAVVVTGAGRGLGQQMALALAEAGADVLCAARTPEQIEATAEAIRALNRRAIAVPTDVRDSAKCAELVRACVDEFGKIDIMLSNAGIGDARGHSVEFWDVTDEDWRDTIDVNLSSAFYCARAASKAMVDAGRAA